MLHKKAPPNPVTSNKNCLFVLIYRWCWVECGSCSMGLAGLIFEMLFVATSVLCVCWSPWISRLSGHVLLIQSHKCQRANLAAQARFRLLLMPCPITSHWLKQSMWTNPKSKGKAVHSAHREAKASQTAMPKISDVGIILPLWKGSGEKGVKSWNSKLICHNVVETSSCS